LDIIYQAQVAHFIERKGMLEQNLNNADALFLSMPCNKTMQNKIEEHPDCETTNRDDPIEILNAIKILRHNPICAK
jgi:hypothetical protein